MHVSNPCRDDMQDYYDVNPKARCGFLYAGALNILKARYCDMKAAVKKLQRPF